jgi:hypothetical protein
MTTEVKGRVARLLAGLTAVGNVFTEFNTFSKGIVLGTRTLDATTEPTNKFLELNTGLYSNYVSDNANILYGFAANVHRNAGANFTVGSQVSAYNDAGINSGAFGVVTQAWNKPTAAGNLVGGELAIINETSSTVSAKVGLDVVFKNRSDGQPGVTAGLGTDSYNAGSRAIQIDSQPRSTAGEKCGWATGILFNLDALDADVNRTAIGIDFANVRYTGVPGPLTAYRMTAAIRFRDFQSILWNGDPSLSTTDPAAPIRTYFDSVAQQFLLTNTGNTRFGVHVSSGDIFLTPLAKINFAPNTGQINIGEDTGKFAVKFGPLFKFGIDSSTGDVKMIAGAQVHLGGDNTAQLIGAGTDTIDGVANTKYVGVSNGLLIANKSFGTVGALTVTTVGAAGAAAALPATPERYVYFYVDGVKYQIPLYLHA